MIFFDVVRDLQEFLCNLCSFYVSSSIGKRIGSTFFLTHKTLTELNTAVTWIYLTHSNASDELTKLWIGDCIKCTVFQSWRSDCSIFNWILIFDSHTKLVHFGAIVLICMRKKSHMNVTCLPSHTDKTIQCPKKVRFSAEKIFLNFFFSMSFKIPIEKLRDKLRFIWRLLLQLFNVRNIRNVWQVTWLNFHLSKSTEILYCMYVRDSFVLSILLFLLVCFFCAWAYKIMKIPIGLK